ncbi:hypothetical protein [Paraburkholderia ginsengisoli]|uniref:Sulfotransferase family protein n=1 Tax=Paraburkholderia ginsengisoli TaxID=311231 RepID=A0A7T4TCC0_9BURK|nr:hypothetical protein [Paraburkholderia ginsengisoli]QQC67890.1 hypothetical protein I6I06_29190 [Paraburkholderia ginsengisoli]
MQDFETLAQMVINEDSQLGTVPLYADGVFQKLPITLDSVTDRIAERLMALLERRAESMPSLLFLWGPCRVGSTALLNVFAESGFQAIYQPIKNLLRAELAQSSRSGNGKTPPEFPLTLPITVIKETSGPYTVAECLFNPLETLLKSGFPPSKIRLIVLAREPGHMLASWTRKWSSRIPPSCLYAHFLLARLNERRIRNTAEQASIPVTNFRSTLGTESASAIKTLFESVGIADHFSPARLTGWKGTSPLHGSFSSITFPQEPKPFELPNLHDPLDGYGVRNRDFYAPSDVPVDEELFFSYGLEKLYRLTVESLSDDRGTGTAG